ncbi:MAG: hypothetical protein JWP87_6298 [Labilithrix sp.]|nr:hypothetical protein [Labilithrix sp.]
MRSYGRLAAAILAAATISSALFLGCSTTDGATPAPQQDAAVEVPEAAATVDGAVDAGLDADAGADAACPPLANDTPRSLACTGLYANVETKQVATGVREFTPAVALWSDGADKTRWIYLPPGAKIDDTNASEWKFPIGTKLWKEFKVSGHRIETRFFQKLGDDFWVHASYQWQSDELSSTRADGADITISGAAYHIPTPSECDKCHNGRRDRVLGFDAVSLGLPGAAGITLDHLAKQGLLTPTPTTTAYTIGDDGTGKAAPALAWLNVNCGVTCHNGNTTATGYPTGLRLRLDPAQLDGGAVASSWDPLGTSIGIGAVTPRWVGQQRIVPGEPDMSLLVQLISQRGTDQMPPIGSLVVDDKDVKIVRDWIQSMPKDAGADGG